ncbi:MAG TPA: YceI family protein [Paenibacillus sp.]|jgi:polyisoprenoid-binding protein YceI
MKKKNILGVVGVVVVVGAIGGYLFFNQYMGNNVEIESVIPAQGQASSAETVDTASTGAKVTSTKLNGDWMIADTSKVYWSVTTSKETVNFVDTAVKGNWSVNVDDKDVMSGEGSIDMTQLDSGNGQRDEHVKSDDYLAIGTYPEASFKAESFSDIPTEWTEGTPVLVEMKGKLTVKGVEKEVSFISEVAYREDQLLLSGTTNVTFSDFGMKNPHTVVLDTENDLGVRLELVLTKAQ